MIFASWKNNYILATFHEKCSESIILPVCYWNTPIFFKKLFNEILHSSLSNSVFSIVKFFIKSLMTTYSPFYTFLSSFHKIFKAVLFDFKFKQNVAIKCNKSRIDFSLVKAWNTTFRRQFRSKSLTAKACAVLFFEY